MTRKHLNEFIELIEERPDDAILATKALTVFNRRQARIDHPEGSTDNGGRWYPEGRDDIGMGVRSPSRSFPWSYMLRCRSLDHVECVFDADHDDVLTVRRGLMAMGQGRNDLVIHEDQVKPDLMKSWANAAKEALSQSQKMKQRKAMAL